MRPGEQAGSPEQIPADEPFHPPRVTARTGTWEVMRRLEALGSLIDRVYRLGPEVIDAAERRDATGFDERLERLVSGLAWDAARMGRADPMPRGKEP